MEVVQEAGAEDDFENEEDKVGFVRGEDEDISEDDNDDLLEGLNEDIEVSDLKHQPCTCSKLTHVHAQATSQVLAKTIEFP